MSDADRIRMSYIEEATYGVTPGARAQATLTMPTIPTADDTITIGGQTYTFKATVTTTADEVLIGANVAASKINLVAAINLDPSLPGSYGSLTAKNTSARIYAFVGDNAIIEALAAGTDGNAIVSTETFTPAGNVIDATTLGDTQLGVVATFQEMRITSEGLRQDTATTTSQEIRSDRQVTDVVRTDISAPGDIGLELSYGSYDDIMKGALYSAAWSSAVDVGPLTTISFDPADNSVNDSANGFGSIVVGQWIRTSGASNAANNGVGKVLTQAAGKLTVSGITYVTEAAAASITVSMGAQIVNGTTETSFTIEKEHTDKAQMFANYLGLIVDSLELSVASGAILTGSLSFQGSKALTPSPRGSSASTLTAATTTGVMNAIDNVTSILEGGLQFDSTQFSMTLANALRPRPQISTLGAISMGAGRVNVTGSMQAYFENAHAMDKYLAFEATSLALVVTDGASNMYVIDFPQVKFTSGQRAAGGTEQDLFVDLEFTAYREATEDVTIRIVRFPTP